MDALEAQRIYLAIDDMEGHEAVEYIRAILAARDRRIAELEEQADTARIHYKEIRAAYGLDQEEPSVAPAQAGERGRTSADPGGSSSVWIVVRSYDYEGYELPQAVFDHKPTDEEVMWACGNRKDDWVRDGDGWRVGFCSVDIEQYEVFGEGDCDA